MAKTKTKTPALDFDPSKVPGYDPKLPQWAPQNYNALQNAQQIKADAAAQDYSQDTTTQYGIPDPQTEGQVYVSLTGNREDAQWMTVNAHGQVYAPNNGAFRGGWITPPAAAKAWKFEGGVANAPEKLAEISISSLNKFAQPEGWKPPADMPWLTWQSLQQMNPAGNTEATAFPYDVDRYRSYLQGGSPLTPLTFDQLYPGGMPPATSAPPVAPGNYTSSQRQMNPLYTSGGRQYQPPAMAGLMSGARGLGPRGFQTTAPRLMPKPIKAPAGTLGPVPGFKLYA